MIADPIFGAIEAHRSALRAYYEAVEEDYRLGEEIPEDRRRSEITVWETSIVDGDDPRWIAIQRATRDLSAKADEAALALVDVAPTTVDGVRALLSYVVDVEKEDEGAWPDVLDDEDVATPSVGGHPWWFFLAHNLATALGQIEGARH